MVQTSLRTADILLGRSPYEDRFGHSQFLGRSAQLRVAFSCNSFGGTWYFVERALAAFLHLFRCIFGRCALLFGHCRHPKIPQQAEKISRARDTPRQMRRKSSTSRKWPLLLYVRCRRAGEKRVPPSEIRIDAYYSRIGGDGGAIICDYGSSDRSEKHRVKQSNDPVEYLVAAAGLEMRPCGETTLSLFDLEQKLVLVPASARAQMEPRLYLLIQLSQDTSCLASSILPAFPSIPMRNDCCLQPISISRQFPKQGGCKPSTFGVNYN